MQHPNMEQIIKQTFTRRTVLKMTAYGAMAAMTGPLLAGCGKKEEEHTALPQGKTLKFLSHDQYVTLVNICNTIIPSYKQFPDAQSVDVALKIDEEMERISHMMSVGEVGKALWLIEHGTLFFGLKFKRFSHLPPAAQYEYIRGWMESRFESRRIIYALFRAATVWFYYTDTRVFDGIGYDGPLIDRINMPAYPVDFGKVI